jgi:hypothetical protein
MRDNVVRYGIRQIWKEKINSAERNWEEIRINNGSNEKKIHNEEIKVNENIVTPVVQTKKGKKSKVSPIEIKEEIKPVFEEEKTEQQKEPVIMLSYSVFNPNKNNEQQNFNNEPEIRLSYMRTIKKPNAFSYIPSTNKDNSAKNAIRITKFNKGFERDYY